MKINNFVTSFDYLNENNSADKNSYLTNTTSYSINDFNNFSFSTRENKTANLTEYYNLIYQYKNDCLAASVEYNKEYYTDRELKPNESIFLKLTIIPFGETSSPNLKINVKENIINFFNIYIFILYKKFCFIGYLYMPQ